MERLTVWIYAWTQHVKDMLAYIRNDYGRVSTRYFWIGTSKYKVLNSNVPLMNEWMNEWFISLTQLLLTSIGYTNTMKKGQYLRNFFTFSL